MFMKCSPMIKQSYVGRCSGKNQADIGDYKDTELCIGCYIMKNMI